MYRKWSILAERGRHPVWLGLDHNRQLEQTESVYKLGRMLYWGFLYFFSKSISKIVFLGQLLCQTILQIEAEISMPFVVHWKSAVPSSGRHVSHIAFSYWLSAWLWFQLYNPSLVCLYDTVCCLLKSTLHTILLWYYYHHLYYYYYYYYYYPYFYYV